MDTTYLWPDHVDSSSLSTPPSSSYNYLFWDASSISFEMGAPCEDFGNQYAAAGAIEDAVESWDNIDSDSLAILYSGEDLYETNDPGDGENVIFFGEHSSLEGCRGMTLITAPASGTEKGEFSDVDIVLNDAKRWTLNAASCQSDTSDVQSTTTHELGHALGLGHATGKRCMTPSEDWCNGGLESEYENLEQRTVQLSDHHGYEYLYVNSSSVRSVFGGGPGSKMIVEETEPVTDEDALVVAPNPFNPQVCASFRLERAGMVDGAVYTSVGQKVVTLSAPRWLEPGVYQYTWDGRNQAGYRASAGVYLLVVRIDGASRARKVTLLP
jgi:hypothetical protein